LRIQQDAPFFGAPEKSSSIFFFSDHFGVRLVTGFYDFKK
jgi:hypothetical protein